MDPLITEQHWAFLSACGGLRPRLPKTFIKMNAQRVWANMLVLVTARVSPVEQTFAVSRLPDLVPFSLLLLALVACVYRV